MPQIPLKYLFGVRFSDSVEYYQTPWDVSVSDPTRSAFYDVAQRLADVELFQLYGEGHRYLVDLRDGHFEIDGVPFEAGDPRVQIPWDTPRRLIYFRRHQHDTVDGVETAHRIEYHFGWQATWEGRNHQQTLVLR